MKAITTIKSMGDQGCSSRLSVLQGELIRCLLMAPLRLCMFTEKTFRHVRQIEARPTIGNAPCCNRYTRIGPISFRLDPLINPCRQTFGLREVHASNNQCRFVICTCLGIHPSRSLTLDDKTKYLETRLAHGTMAMQSTYQRKEQMFGNPVMEIHWLQ